MLIVHVSIHVKPACIEEFIAASVTNAHTSILEPGIARFDFIQQVDAPNRFMLIEVYYMPEDALMHKETAHYTTWRDTVADMMAEPRQSIKFSNIVPDEDGWD